MVAYRQPLKGRITDLVIDSTGFKVLGEGELKVRKHGTETQRVWRKLHLAVEPTTHDIVVAEVPLENVHDVKVLPTLLKLLRRKGLRLYSASQLRKKRHLRNEAVLVMLKAGLAHRKKMQPYLE